MNIFDEHDEDRRDGYGHPPSKEYCEDGRRRIEAIRRRREWYLKRLGVPTDFEIARQIDAEQKVKDIEWMTAAYGKKRGRPKKHAKGGGV